MQIRSLGNRTDLIFPRFDSIIIERDDYIVIRTPSNPNFYWGNFLLFRNPPAPGDDQRWVEIFHREIGSPPEFNHLTFGWDSPAGELGAAQSFVDSGFTLFESVVFTACSTDIHRPPKFNEQVTIRPLTEDWEWQAAIESQIYCRLPHFQEQPYRVFKVNQFDRYRKMAQAGLGHWFGAFLDGKMVANLGLYRDQEVGRFQNVETLPEYRRQGICGALVYFTARYGFEQMGLQTLVMVADEHYHAAAIYETIGFRPTERQLGLEKA